LVDSRRSRLLRATVVLAVLSGLAACTAGVPRTGEVVTLSQVTTSRPPDDPEGLEDVGGPSSGQSESEVAVGFMNAMNTGDVSAVQRWVMPEARDQVTAWDEPTTTVRVYSVFEPGLEYVSGERRVVPIRVKLVGQLRGGRDWYPATGDETLRLQLENDGGDPRVANPGPVIWMRDVNFSRLHASAEVFMVPDLTDPSPQLAPVPVFVPKGDEGSPDALRLRVEDAIEVLLDGPQGRYDNLETAIPRGTELQGFEYADDVATINLSKRFTDPEGSGLVRVGQLVWTVNRLLPTVSVRIQVESRPVGALGVDRFPADRPWRRWDKPLAGMWPKRSQEHQDDSILFVRQGEIYTIPPQVGQSPRPVEVDAPSPKSAPTWSPDHRWMAFLAGSGADQSLWLDKQSGGSANPVDDLVGRLSAPTWSPDSRRLYVVRKDQSGARLLEITRDTQGFRSLALPPLPRGLEPSSIAVSPDGAFVLAVADRPARRVEDAEPVPGGELFLGQLGPEGVIRWSSRQLAPGLGRVYSPVWADPVTIAFIAETENKDDLGKLWTVKSDGWDPTAVLNDSNVPPWGDIGNSLTVDPTGRSFVVTARSSNGAALWMVNRQDKAASPLTFPEANAFDTDPSFASH
jgi:Sporulation and spore germination/WD40-like Beta Propeller Repeat